MEKALIIVLTCYILCAFPSAIYGNIDDRIPDYAKKRTPFSNFVYKILRIGGAVLCMFITYSNLFWMGVGLWFLAFLWKELMLRFNYGKYRRL